MNRDNISVDEYYHIYNRGVGKKIIFKDDRDRIRFLFLILYFQAENNFPQISRIISSFVKHRVFDIDNKIINNIISKRFVELAGFALVSNHFHLIVKEAKEGGIGKYMQRVLNSYTKYFNTRYGVTGHLFEGPYKAVHVEDNEQLLHLSAYVHLNPRELSEWRKREDSFPWSSYQDYVKENRWGYLLKNEIIVEQFRNKKEYKDFVETSGAKELEEELAIDCQTSGV
ncbi:transposase [Candidatus Nomurabacteria bacterium]|nr:transposase [Candidatus Nomurabacteria bacterium]